MLESIPEVDDAIVVNLDLPGGHFFMPMLVKLADGITLDDRVTNEINARLRREYTPGHVPDKIIPACHAVWAGAALYSASETPFFALACDRCEASRNCTRYAGRGRNDHPRRTGCTLRQLARPRG